MEFQKRKEVIECNLEPSHQFISDRDRCERSQSNNSLLEIQLVVVFDPKEFLKSVKRYSIDQCSPFL